MTGELINPSFDYSILSNDEEKDLRFWEMELFQSHKRLAEEVIKHGKFLKEAQGVLASHAGGTFQAWVASLGISTRSAYNAIDAYESFRGYANVHNLEVSALYVLAKNDKAKSKALKLVDKGVKVTHAMAKRLVEQSTPKLNGKLKPPPPAADDPPFDEAPQAEVIDVELEPVSVEEPEDLGRCPVCLKEKWTTDDSGYSVCVKCGHFHGEPAGDPDGDVLTTLRSKTVKTCEALMRSFDDLQMLKQNTVHEHAIADCKRLLEVAKGWK